MNGGGIGLRWMEVTGRVGGPSLISLPLKHPHSYQNPLPTRFKLFFTFKFQSNVEVRPLRLMFEMTDACQDHGDAVFVGFFDGVFVTDGPSWLDDGCDACFGRCFYGVIHREEGV